mmetsp:Transcript_819/g.1438  ORF Transcript_819/g.1438 Transcript_819/m.1438 type:complete len:211 (-) Transcript_819:262-894(-)
MTNRLPGGMRGRKAQGESAVATQFGLSSVWLVIRSRSLAFQSLHTTFMRPCSFLLHILASIGVETEISCLGFLGFQGLLCVLYCLFKFLFVLLVLFLNSVCPSNSVFDGSKNSLRTLDPILNSRQHGVNLTRPYIPTHSIMNFQALIFLIQLPSDEALIDTFDDQVLQLSDVGYVQLPQKKVIGQYLAAGRKGNQCKLFQFADLRWGQRA